MDNAKKVWQDSSRYGSLGHTGASGFAATPSGPEQAEVAAGPSSAGAQLFARYSVP